MSKIGFRRIRSHILRGLLVIVAAIFALAFLLPTILTITNSFMTATEITANYGMIFENASTSAKKFIAEAVNLKFIPDKVSFSQYATFLIKSPDYLLKFWNSVFLVVPIVIFQVLVASFAAYGFSRYHGRLRELIFFSYIILMLMPYQVTLVPNYLVSRWLHIINTRWAIILTGIFSPLAVFILTKYMRRIPLSYVEAAKLDGAGEWQIFTKLFFPLSGGVLYSVAILVFIDYWNMVEQPIILLSDSSLHPLSVFLSKINAGEVGLAFAAATVYMIPTLLMFLHGEEYLVEGITYSGGIKG